MATTDFNLRARCQFKHAHKRILPSYC